MASLPFHLFSPGILDLSLTPHLPHICQQSLLPWMCLESDLFSLPPPLPPCSKPSSFLIWVISLCFYLSCVQYTLIRLSDPFEQKSDYINVSASELFSGSSFFSRIKIEVLILISEALYNLFCMLSSFSDSFSYYSQPSWLSYLFSNTEDTICPRTFVPTETLWVSLGHSLSSFKPLLTWDFSLLTLTVLCLFSTALVKF